MVRRVLFLLFLTWLSVFGWSQTPTESKPAGGREVKPDVTVVVWEHSTGADMVEITPLAQDYSPGALADQCRKIGTLVGVPIRGLAMERVSLDKSNPNLGFVKARFAMDGLVDKPNNLLRLGAIAKAFAGGLPPNEVKGILVILRDFVPNKKTIRAFSNDSVRVMARVVPAPNALEYSIELLSQDPDKIEIPEQIPETRTEPKPQENPSSPSGLVWVLLGVAGVAAGVLVYLAFLRGGAPKRA